MNAYANGLLNWTLQSARIANPCNPWLKNMSTVPQRQLYRLINEAADRGERVVVATVAHTRGSTPQQRGAKMLFFQNGEVAGTVGGGCIEAEVWAEAKEAMRSGESQLHHFSLTADEASEEGMVCGGTMDVFVEVLCPKTS
jgi:xanthine/CO dehydrogenase XdhC/CoxF family maturation factor